MPADRRISVLVLAELYDSADTTVLDLMLEHRANLKPLLGLIEKWKKDGRPWARRLKIDFLTRTPAPWDVRLVFKRLFKQAWIDRDHELMGLFLYTLDCSVRRTRARRLRFLAGTVETTEVLRLSQRTSIAFSTPTKHYLRRRAWRYFRRLGHADPTAYINAMAGALARYTDDDVRAGENLLDCWGLMHACFGKSPQLAFDSRHTNLAPTGRLADLVAAPMFERHWAADGGFPILLDLLLRAGCRPVRVWAIQLLQRLHAGSLPRIDARTLLRLIDHADPDVARFGADLLGHAQTVSSFPIATWMDLLATRNPTVVATITGAFRKHVSFDRVSLAQAVELAVRTAVPVVRLGLEILESRPVRTDGEVAQLAGLSAARCSAVGSELARFALSRLNVAGVYRLDDIIAFFDSRLRTLRDGAFDALAARSPADTDPAFWARLFESPYDDVRSQLVDRLKTRLGLPGASSDAMASLWQSVLLNIHRGGRAKLSALRQISSYVTRKPDVAKSLLPVLAIAIRSVRPPEARHGLAAVVSAVEHTPALADEVKRLLPELQLDGTGAPR